MNQYNILVAEDDLDIQELMVEFLNANNYNVDAVSDGVECMHKFKEKDYDLIILDIMMPNLDGYTTCKMIRNTSNVPIIFLTALNEESNQMNGFDIGADDYITKPFSFNILIKRVEAVLRRSSNSVSSEFLSFDNLRLNLNTYSIEVEDRDVELTLKEFNILI